MIFIGRIGLSYISKILIILIDVNKLLLSEVELVKNPLYIS